MADDIRTTLAVWRPSRQWTVLYEHSPYAPALWALLFDPSESLTAAEHFGPEWERISAQTVMVDHVVGYRTTAGKDKERLVARLEQARTFPMVWRALSLTKALALSLLALPSSWPVRLDASTVTIARGGQYADLMGAAIQAASELGARALRDETEALRALLAMAHGLNPETILAAPSSFFEPHLPWPRDAATIAYALLGKPVECPTSHLEHMTRARQEWGQRWVSVLSNPSQEH
jgi:hypothetical protein